MAHAQPAARLGRGAAVRQRQGAEFARLQAHWPPLSGTSVGWYRREFEIPAGDAGKRIAVEFDGAFRDVLVFVNGCFIGRNNNGYAPFRFDLTDFLPTARRTTSSRASMPASATDGSTRAPASIATCGSPRPMRCTWASGRARCAPSMVSGDSAALTLATWSKTRASRRKTQSKLADSRRSRQDRGHGRSAGAVDCRGWHRHSFSATRNWPARRSGRRCAQSLFGDRHCRIERQTARRRARQLWRAHGGLRCRQGLLLNGKSLKIQGTCNHQDHAGVGAACPDRLQVFRWRS
jgi:beta-galactosidase